MAAILVAAACGGRSPDPAEWAAEAEVWHDALMKAQIAEGGAAYAKFLAPDVVWDHRANFSDHPQLHVGEDAVWQADRLAGPESVRLEPEIFISVDGLVEFYFYDFAPLGNDGFPETEEPQHGVSLMAPIGPSGVEWWVTATAIEDWRAPRPDWPQADEAEVLATAWTGLWSGTSDDIDLLYRNDARVHDSIAAVEVTGHHAIAELAAGAGTWEITTVDPDAVRGVYPLVRGPFEAKVLEEVVLVVAGEDRDGCEGEMVVWLVLDEGLVAAETRYWPIERARRCLPAGERPDGWWTDRPVPRQRPQPTEDLDTPTDPLVLGGATITVYNGTPNLTRLLAWGLGRFEAAGLTPPTIASATFTLYSEYCDDMRAWYRPTDEGADLGFCFDEDYACWDESCISFTPFGRRLMLHELAHAWMDATLDEPARRRYTDYAGLAVWNSKSVTWREQAWEHAAETITWGLMDRDINALQIGYLGPEQLSEGFRLLTGTDPLPRTDVFPPGSDGQQLGRGS